jgi:hypothetical protein
MENPAFIGASLSDVKVIMMIMRILVVKLLCLAVTRWVPLLQCLLHGTHGLQRLRLIMSASNGLVPQGTRLCGHLLGSKTPQVWLPGAWAHAEAGYKEDMDWGDGW